MLFRKDKWPGLADGTITVALRWWKRPTVKAGGTLNTAAGQLAIDTVEVIEPDQLTEADARVSGHHDLDELRSILDRNRAPDRRLHRITFHLTGEDPRIALRLDDDLDAETIADLSRRLDRSDASAETPWTRDVLRVIADNPGVVSTDLAERVGLDRATFKTRVRRLKSLGLTESLAVGYRLSPRGAELLRRLAR